MTELEVNDTQSKLCDFVEEYFKFVNKFLINIINTITTYININT